MSLAIIANPSSGRGRGRKTIEQITTTIKEKQIDCELLVTKHPLHAIELAEKAARNHEIVAGLGGDGTINEVLNGIWQSDAKLGIIPSGTGNDYARSLDIPFDPNKAFEVLLAGKENKIDIVHETDRVFGVVSTIGFPSTVLEYVNLHSNSWLKGKYVFFASVIQTIRHLKSYPVKVTIDNTSYEFNTIGIFLMNMLYSGGGLQFAPEARHDDGQISIVMIKDLGRFELMKTLPRVYNGGHVNHPQVEIVQGKEVIIEADQVLKKSFEGDLVGVTPLRAKIYPQAVSVIRK